MASEPFANETNDALSYSTEMSGSSKLPLATRLPSGAVAGAIAGSSPPVAVARTALGAVDMRLTEATRTATQNGATRQVRPVMADGRRRRPGDR